MDGTRHEVSVRLIAASIPLQALMMAGVAIVALGAVTHGQSAPAVPAGQLPPGYAVPGKVCWNTGVRWDTGAQSQPGDGKALPVAGGCMMNVAPGSAPQRLKVIPVTAVPRP